MPTNNFKLFDENKANMLTDEEYQNSQQRLTGVQSGIASSMLNNKFAYQMSLVSYAIAQMMNANGYDASDSLAVSAFVGNLSNSVLQKVIDKALTADAEAGTDNLKWMTPALVKAFFDYRLATQAEAEAGTDNTKWMSPLRVSQAMTKGYLPLSGGTLTGPLTLSGNPTSALQAATKQYVDSQFSGLDAQWKNLGYVSGQSITTISIPTDYHELVLDYRFSRAGISSGSNESNIFLVLDELQVPVASYYNTKTAYTGGWSGRIHLLSIGNLLFSTNSGPWSTERWFGAFQENNSYPSSQGQVNTSAKCYISYSRCEAGSGNFRVYGR